MSSNPPVPPVPPTPPATKICLECDAEVGASEKKCPKCGVVFEDAEQEMTVVEKALKRIAKKNKRARPAPTPTPDNPSVKKSIFSSLNRKR